MSIEQYKFELEQHDWYYEFSDSHFVWKRGSENESKLKKIAYENGAEFMQAFDEVWMCKFNKKEGEVIPPMLGMCGGDYKAA